MISFRPRGSHPIDTAARTNVTGQLAGAARLVVDAMHVMAVSQLSHADPVRDHEERKGGEGKTQKEAVRALKRQISDVVYRQLVRDAQR